MRRILIVLAFVLVPIALCATTCDVAAGGSPISSCEGPNYNPGYLGAYEVSWDVTVQGTPTGETDTSGTWDANTTATPHAGTAIQYAGYEYEVELVNVHTHTMSVKWVQSC